MIHWIMRSFDSIPTFLMDTVLLDAALLQNSKQLRKNSDPGGGKQKIWPRNFPLALFENYDFAHKDSKEE